MINWEGKDQNLLALIKYIANEDKLEKVIRKIHKSSRHQLFEMESNQHQDINQMFGKSGIDYLRILKGRSDKYDKI